MTHEKFSSTRTHHDTPRHTMALRGSALLGPELRTPAHSWKAKCRNSKHWQLSLAGNPGHHQGKKGSNAAGTPSRIASKNISLKPWRSDLQAPLTNIWRETKIKASTWQCCRHVSVPNHALFSASTFQCYTYFWYFSVWRHAHAMTIYDMFLTELRTGPPWGSDAKPEPARTRMQDSAKICTRMARKHNITQHKKEPVLNCANKWSSDKLSEVKWKHYELLNQAQPMTWWWQRTPNLPGHKIHEESTCIHSHTQKNNTSKKQHSKHLKTHNISQHKHE